MKLFAILFAAFFLISSVSAFSIVSYENNAEVLSNGDLSVYEKMAFNLDEVYSEGYRAIRPQDFGSLSSITVHSVKLNGENVPYETVMNGDTAEIIWKKTVIGNNLVELNYTLKNQVEIYDDFARICYEHYGANWPVSAQSFSSRMTLPEETRDTTMHFEIYSSKKGEAYIDGLSIVIEMDNVPSGNYIGGCYLFYKGAVNTSNTVSGSAYEILQGEREEFGSESVLEPETDAGLCLGAMIVLFIGILGLAVKFYLDGKKTPLYPESIIPPEKEEPCVVSVLMRNELSKKDIMAATILKLISRNVLDIVELEKKGKKSAELNRERTILLLKKKDAQLKGYEQAIVDMLFEKGTEVDLDEMAEEFGKVKSQTEAKKLHAVKQLDKFDDEIEKILKSKSVWELRKSKNERLGILIGISMFAFFFACVFFFYALESVSIYLADGKFAEFSLFMLAVLGMICSVAYLVHKFLQSSAPVRLREKFAKWDGFVRAIKTSRLKEYPPASAVIWDDIIVYATALGLADKVEKHLSELKSFDIKKIEKMEKVNSSVFIYYNAAFAVSNLSKYGSRSGPRSSGGFSSGSSGGWSGGGGGFSGGSSGGGGFR